MFEQAPPMPSNTSLENNQETINELVQANSNLCLDSLGHVSVAVSNLYGPESIF
jgi:hypothetical protein